MNTYKYIVHQIWLFMKKMKQEKASMKEGEASTFVTGS